MSNEVVFLASASIDILIILYAARRGIEWLVGTVITNLILVGIFGAKLITIFGLITNAGNVFYACVFLATHFILERYGKEAGMKTIWYGVGFVLLFTALSQLAVAFRGMSESDIVNDALVKLFPFSLRIVIASMLAYIFAQHINIILYERIKTFTGGRLLWFRSNGANVVSQLADSSLFFSIAFLDLPGPTLVQAILAGWLIKTLVVMMGTPFLYFDAHFKRTP